MAELHDDEGPVTAALDALDTALDCLDEASIDTMSHPRLLEVMHRLERVNRRLPVTEHRVITRLAAEANPVDLGGKTLSRVLAFHLQIGHGDAHRLGI